MTGKNIGIEIETDFVKISDDTPISESTGRAILANAPKNARYRVLAELGRQKIEIAVDPHGSIQELLETAHEALNWLYSEAKVHGAKPIYGELFPDSFKLLMITEKRDELWAELDGTVALEALCRCSSVQFTIDVNPKDAIGIINKMWEAKLHEIDYVQNDALWNKYIAESHANYHSKRYAGPDHFTDLRDYCDTIAEFPLLMHHEKAVRLHANSVKDMDPELFLRSVWWHYRLRRYGDTLTVEIRPFTRRSDECFSVYWNKVAPFFGLELI